MAKLEWIQDSELPEGGYFWDEANQCMRNTLMEEIDGDGEIMEEVA